MENDVHHATPKFGNEKHWVAADFDARVHDEFEGILQSLHEWCAIPTISAHPERKGDVERGAEKLRTLLIAAGCEETTFLTAGGNPIVYGRCGHDDEKPTVLIYGHYDVQPPDPLDAWTTPPFEPTLRNGALYARGAVDDKGQVLAHVEAIRMLNALGPPLPVNVIFLVEGEEEIGSPTFATIVQEHREMLRCDCAVISDTTVLDRVHPAICVGLRGLASLEITVLGPSKDLHSGEFGGAVANPAEVLAHLIAGMKDITSGKVLIPGFYDNVEVLTTDDREALAALPFNEEAFKDHAGVTTLVGEEGWTPLERLWLRPTLEVNGIGGGYQGAGDKTIVPSRAFAKITCRIVPNQDPALVSAAVRDWILAQMPVGVIVDVAIGSHGNPVVTSLDHPHLKAAESALREVFGVDPVYIREGGSIPPAEVIQRICEVPVMLIGFGLQEENYHAPDECFHLDMLEKSLRVIGRLWHYLPNYV